MKVRQANTQRHTPPKDLPKPNPVPFRPKFGNQPAAAFSAARQI
jgi:hypothetical protein